MDPNAQLTGVIVLIAETPKVVKPKQTRRRTEHCWIVSSVPTTDAGKAALRRDKARLDAEGFRYKSYLSEAGNVVVEAFKAEEVLI